MSLTLAGATAIAGGLAAAGSAAGIGAQAASNKAVAKLQNQFNIDMWKMTNAYNDPQAQMQRMERAGLNPLLIYGQNSTGNASSPPQQVAPISPDFQGHLSKLGLIFNIEQLMLLDSQRKKADEDARIAELHRFDLEDERDAVARMQSLYDYDMSTGRFVWSSPPDVVVTAKNPRGSRIGDSQIGAGLMMQKLAAHDPRALYLKTLRRYLEPQIWMENYNRQYHPWSFWIGNGAKALNALPFPKLNFRFNSNFK